jgi:hypothetical protein
VVIDLVEDLDHLAIRQLPGGDVRLPQLVGQLGLKAGQRAARALLWLTDDQPLSPQNPPDARDRGDVFMGLSEVVGDRLTAGVVALSLEL